MRVSRRSDRTALLALQAREHQQAWVGNIADVLADLDQCPRCESMSIWHAGRIVGHYRLDPDAQGLAGRDFDLPTLGLRGFFIDARWQGQGVGAAALSALFADLAIRHRHARQLALCVGTDNRVAHHLYVQAGFVDQGALYHDGPGHAQHLLLRGLS